MLNVVVVSDTVRACRRSQNFGGHWAPTLDGGVAHPLETRYCPTCVIIPNFVALGQNVWAQVGRSQKIYFGTLGPRPFGIEVVTTYEHACP